MKHVNCCLRPYRRVGLRLPICHFMRQNEGYAANRVDVGIPVQTEGRKEVWESSYNKTAASYSPDEWSSQGPGRVKH